MSEAFERKLRSVRRRCSLNLAMELSAWMLLVAGTAALAAALVERLLALKLISMYTAGGVLGSAVLAAGVLWLFRRPGRMQTALLIDQQLGLRERFSTTLALSGSEDPFARAADEQAHQVAKSINIKGQFPVRPSRRWAYTLTCWAAFCGVFFLMPTLDLLGRKADAAIQQRKAQQLAQSKAEVKETIATVQEALKQVDGKLAADLAKLEGLNNAARPEDIKRDAIRALGELSDKLKKMQQSQKLETNRELQEMLRQLHTAGNGKFDDFNRDLARGDFAAAKNELKEIQKQLNEGKLSPDQQKDLEKQLKELAKQLEELAKSDKALQDALEKAGLPKDMAKATEEQIRDAAKKQGLTQEQIDELMKKVGNCKSAAMACKKLGDAMNVAVGEGGGKISPEGLVGLLDDLDQLDRESLSRAQIDKAMAECAKALGELGGECDGMGNQGLFADGDNRKRGPGTGGPGQGYGERETADPSDTGVEKTGIKNENKTGQVIASWLFKGSQVKGETKQQLTNTIQAAKDRAADAVTENRIPREYQSVVGPYFGGLEQATTQKSN